MPLRARMTVWPKLVWKEVDVADVIVSKVVPRTYQALASATTCALAVLFCSSGLTFGVSVSHL